MRRDRLKINKATGLKEIKEDLRATLKEQRTLALKQLEVAADELYTESRDIVPVETGRLRDSIIVDVSRSPRYPGIIATAEAHNPRTGYDYALIQEVNESYRHNPGQQAHYLEQPFRRVVEKFFKEMDWK